MEQNIIHQLLLHLYYSETLTATAKYGESYKSYFRSEIGEELLTQDNFVLLKDRQ